MDYLQKPVTCSKSLVHLSKVSIYVSKHISAIRMTSPYVTDHKQVSHVVNITVYSVFHDVN